MLRLIARKYEFKDDVDRLPLVQMVQAAFPLLLPIFQVRGAAPRATWVVGRGLWSTDPAPGHPPLLSAARTCPGRPRNGPSLLRRAPLQSLLSSDSTSLELAELLKLICKVYWSSTYMEIPELMTHPDAIRAWMACFQALIVRPLPLVGLGARGRGRQA